MPGEAQRKPRRKDAFLLSLLVLLAFGLWLLATTQNAPSQMHIVTTIFKAQILRQPDYGLHDPTELAVIRATGKRFSRQHRKEALTHPHVSVGWPTKLSSTSDDAYTYGQSAARAWEHLIQEGASRIPENIGLEDSQDQRLVSRKGSKIAHRIQKGTSSDSIQAVGKAVQSSRVQDVLSSIEQIAGLPAEFDWQTYLLYYPDLRQAGIDTESKARQHYLEWGHSEGRLHKRLRVLLRYTACTGLINQHYSHIAAFALSKALQSELVLPPAAQRDSFGKYFSTRKDENEVSWTPVHLSSLLDVEKIIDTWRIRGMTVHEVSKSLNNTSPTWSLLFH